MAALAAVCFVWAPGAASASSGCIATPSGWYNPNVTITFTGSYNDDEEDPEPTGNIYGYVSTRVALTWTVTVTGPIYQSTTAGCYPSPDQTTLTASGSVSGIGSSGSGVPNCSATISPTPSQQGVYWELANGTSSDPQDNPSSPDATEWGTSVNGITPLTDVSNSGEPSPLQSTDTNPADACSSIPGPSYFSDNPPDPNYSSSTGPSFTGPDVFNNVAGGLDPVGPLIGPTTGTWSFSDSGSDGYGGTDTVSGSDTLSYNLAGQPPSTTTTPPCQSDQSCCDTNIFNDDLFGPTCTPVKPKKPDKTKLRAAYEKAARFFHMYCTPEGLTGPPLEYGTFPYALVEARTNPFIREDLKQLGRDVIVSDGCKDALASVLDAQDALASDPPDSHYALIGLPESWPGPAPRTVSCKQGKGRVACKRLGSALKRYMEADDRTAEVWEALAVTADRWGSAYAAFSTDPNAPVGLALQTALSKAYYGELGQALAAQANAAKTVDRALHAAGLGRVSLTAKQRRKAKALLKKSKPPSWLVNWMVSNGTATSAASVRAAWRALLKGAKVPASLNLKPLFPDGRSVPQIPGETYGSITVDDLYWISNAVPDTAGRDALIGFVTQAREATTSAAERAALEQFLAYAKQRETGQLSVLLQTAVAPLLG